MKNIKQILTNHVNINVRQALSAFDERFFDGVSEMRLRADKPMVFWKTGKPSAANFIPKRVDITECLEIISGFSLYAFGEEIKAGFITVEGGHRVGIAGQAVVEDGRVKTIKNVSALNFRIAREIKGCAEMSAAYVLNPLAKGLLIVSPPGRGKTTFLRDIIRIVSDSGVNVGVVDERGEIAACHMGLPQNDVGRNTDVLDLCPKARGISMMIRAMSPNAVAVDELFGKDDTEAAYGAANAGVSLFCTAHGRGIGEAARRAGLGGLIRRGVFSRFVILAADGEIRVEKILDENLKELFTDD
jgi:stage III sporulation protein AA